MNRINFKKMRTQTRKDWDILPSECVRCFHNKCYTTRRINNGSIGEEHEEGETSLETKEKRIGKKKSSKYLGVSLDASSSSLDKKLYGSYVRV